jgi:predicted MFS family arabinose efflux permease
MNLRNCIIFMSGLAVVSDAVLVAFYPQFFERRYGLTGTLEVGAYIAAISLAVMCTFPLWARLARRVDTLRLVIWTQCGAGALCALSYWAPTALAYCAMTLPMFMLKSSYLLMFPYLMRMEAPSRHPALVGLLSVVVHVGGIFGTVAGGMVMQRFGPAACLWLMAAGDFGQMLVCGHLIRSGKAPRLAPEAEGEGASAGLRGVSAAVLRLCVVMLVFDFSGHLVSPFFSVLWEQVSGMQNEAVAGAVYAVPGVVALAAMLVNRRCSPQALRRLDHLQFNLLLGAVGLGLQAVPQEAVMLIGRVLFGWSLFQAIVKLEVGVFKLSRPASYAVDYSLANFFQNLGVLVSSFAAGAIVGRWGVQVTFVIGAAGLLLTALLDRTLVRIDAVAEAAGPSSDKPTEFGHAG